MHTIKATHLGKIIAILLAALVLFGGLAVTYDVSTVDDRGAVAEASSGPGQWNFGEGCHSETYIDIWRNGVKWRSSRFDGPSFFNTNIYHHSASRGWVWHLGRGYTFNDCVVLGNM